MLRPLLTILLSCRAKPAFKGVQDLTICQDYSTFNFEAILPFAKSG